MGEREITQPSWDLQTGGKVRAVCCACCPCSILQLLSTRRWNCNQKASAALLQDPTWGLDWRHRHVQPIWLKVAIKNVWFIVINLGCELCCLWQGDDFAMVDVEGAQAVGMDWWQAVSCSYGRKEKDAKDAEETCSEEAWVVVALWCCLNDEWQVLFLCLNLAHWGKVKMVGLNMLL